MKTTRKILFILCIGCLLVFQCKRPQKADFSRTERLIASGKYQQALSVLRDMETKAYLDSTVYFKIRKRIFDIHRTLFFKDLDQMIHKGQWTEAKKLLPALDSSLKDSSREVREKYLFDFFSKKAKVAEALQDTATSFNALKKAVTFWTDHHAQLQSDYESLAFAFALRHQMVKARAMMDKALRMEDLTRLGPALHQVFYLYMNGKFKEALQKLKSVPDTRKSKHWKSLELFLSQFGNRLTLKDRFKLW